MALLIEVRKAWCGFLTYQWYYMKGGALKCKFNGNYPVASCVLKMNGLHKQNTQPVTRNT